MDSRSYQGFGTRTGVRRLGVVALATVLGGAGPAAPAPAAPATAAAAQAVVAAQAAAAQAVVVGAPPSRGVDGRTVTLITGDRVRVTLGPGGLSRLGIQPGPGRRHIGFVRDDRTGPDGRHLRVVPVDALPLLAANRLDPRLFDVTELLRQAPAGQAAGQKGPVPGQAGPVAGSARHQATVDGPAVVPAPAVIVTYAATGTARPTAADGPAASAAADGPTTPNGPAAVPGAAAVRALPSVGGAAIRPDRDRAGELWRWLAGGVTGDPARLPGGIGKVWLDAVARPALNVSAVQVGAPAAWRAGLTGTGVTVGMLDTGVRRDHPELAGRVVEAVDFTGTRPDGGDDVGHGTHVAGVIAGNGATYRGIAPDARLISGKVCVVGACPTSAIIAGMEWVAPRARVVNLSLGTGATDGTDPLSRAVDTLTARHGTLFVAAAGDGDDPTETVGAPAAADAALAVGSVDAQDRTSFFSMRGPRLGDEAVKPDLAAPGEGVVSARAPGTPAGDADPVDEQHTRMSGTSVAAPHVAGAAALLAQRHPDWRADRLKATLMSSAQPTAPVLEQGAGRLDIARAVGQSVTATGGSLSFGFVAWPRPRTVVRPVVYRNDGDTAVPLDLRVQVTDADGRPAPAGLVTVSGSRVNVPAHGTATVPVTLHPGAAGAGRYSGRVTAVAPGVAVTTALAVRLEAESYDLRVRFRNRPGTDPANYGQAVDVRTGQAYGIRVTEPDGSAVVRLPKGRYDVNALNTGTDPRDPDHPAVTVLSRPGVTLARPGTVTLDATAGRPVRLVVDRPDATLQSGELGLVSGDPTGTVGGTLSWFTQGQYRLFLAPTPRVTDHLFAFYLRATLAAGPLPAGPGAYSYQLAFLRRGGIPADPTFTAHDRDLATVDTEYHTQHTPAAGVRADFARLPLPGFESGVLEVYPQPLPGRRTEYYTADPEVTWEQLLGVGPADQSDGEVHVTLRTYRPGSYLAHWNRAPLGPAFGAPTEGYGIRRDGSDLRVSVTLLSGNDPHQYTRPPLAMTGRTTLTRDGVVLGTSDTPGEGTFALPAGPGTYTLRATAERSVDWSVLGTRADVSWTFREPGAAAPAGPLPLLVVRAAGPVDGYDRAPAGRLFPLTTTVQRQPGSPAAPLAALGVEVSYDDGGSWTAVPTVRAGDRGLSVLRHPAGDGFASLRITARDSGGSRVVQTVLRAYRIHAG